MTRQTAAIRSGFTLIELLVVIAIIAVLAALTTAAVFQVQDMQRASSTENAMRAVAKALEQQWEAVLKQANDERIPDGVVSMAGGDSRRARVIWKCLRLRQEFPMNFAEAQNPVPGGDPFFLTAALPPKSAYANASGAGPAEMQSATCLLLALQPGRGVSPLTEDNIPGNVAPSVNGLKQIVDGYGNAMVLFRFPNWLPPPPDPPPAPLTSADTKLYFDSTPARELDQRNPAKAGSRAAKFRNPLDPDGALMDSSWNNAANAADTTSGMYWFEQLLFLVHDPNAATYTPLSTYMVPTLVSSGKNGRLGLDLGTPSVLGFSNTMSVAKLPDSATAANSSNDNIYSFRLGFDKRGN